MTLDVTLHDKPKRKTKEKYAKKDTLPVSIKSGIDPKTGGIVTRVFVGGVEIQGVREVKVEQAQDCITSVVVTIWPTSIRHESL